MLRERIERPSLLLHNSAFTTKLSELNLNKPSLFVRTVGPSKTELVLIDDKDFAGQPTVGGLNKFLYVGHIFININSTYFRNLYIFFDLSWYD